MGEIAEALRRARFQRAGAPVPSDPEPTPARTGSPAVSAPPLAVPPAPSHPTTRVASVLPANPAVILEGPHAEACRHVALRTRSALRACGARSLAVVSAERADGKTTVACDLAVALAAVSAGRDVALVDLDLRRPSIRHSLSLRPSKGIEDVLAGRARLESVQVEVGEPEIDVYPAVVSQRDAHKLLLQPQLASLIQELERRYAFVIVDTPPAPLVPDASLLLNHVDVCAAVVRAGKTRMRSIRKLVQCLPREQVLGWILNGERSHAFGSEDYYYYGEGPPAEALGPAEGAR